MKLKSLAQKIEEARECQKDGHTALSDRTGASVSDGSNDSSMLTDGSVQAVLCRSGDRFIAFPVSDVKELVATSRLTISPLPSLTLPHLGLVRRSGELIPVARISELLTVSSSAAGASERTVVCRIVDDGRVIPFALVVDEVVSVFTIEAESLQSVSLKFANEVSDVVSLFKKVFIHDGKEYFLIDTSALYDLLFKTVKRRKV